MGDFDELKLDAINSLLQKMTSSPALLIIYLLLKVIPLVRTFVLYSARR